MRIRRRGRGKEKVGFVCAATPDSPTLIEAPSRSIRDVVAENLIGLEYRNQQRADKRRKEYERALERKAARRKRGAVQKPLTLEEEAKPMQIIKVSFRAIVEQPTGKLNPSGIKLPGPIKVEVFQKGTNWIARSLETRAVFEKLGAHPSAAAGRQAVEQNFQHIREVWQVWRGGGGVMEAYPLSAGSFQEIDGKYYMKEPEDFTHIMKTGPNVNTDGNAKHFTAACESLLSPKVFINVRANVEPTCRACAEIWKKEYQGKTA